MRSRAAKIVMALTVAAATVLAVTLVSNGGSSRNGSQSQNHPAISSFVTAGASKKCVYTATHSGRRLSLPPAKVNTEVRYTAVLRTNLGNIVIGLNSRAPCTVNSFVHLAEAGLNIVRDVAQAGYKCEYTLAGDGVPRKKIVINSVTITKGAASTQTGVGLD